MELFAFAALHPFLAGFLALLMIPVSLLLSDIYTWYYLPPGPLPIPFIGNVLSIPSEKFFVTLEQWSHIYGPIYTIWIGRSPRIVITDPAIAVELLARRGNRSSSRPRMIMFGELFSNNTSVASLPYGEEWAIHRKLLHYSLKGSATPTFKPRQAAEALALTASIVKNSEDWSRGIDRYASSVVFSMAYGRRIASDDSVVLKTRKEFFRYAVSDFLARWRKLVIHMGQAQAAFDLSLVDAVKDDMQRAKGPAVASLTGTMLQPKAKGDPNAMALNDAHLAAISASLFGAGSYTTASTLHSFVLGVLTQPRVQQIAHTELDAIVGKDRSPTFSDQAKLPYIDAIIKEVLRWRPSAAFGMPHATTEADVYNGYRIPKGTSIWAPSWGLNQNPEYFPSPQTFAPHRYLAESDPRHNSKIAAKPFPGGSHGYATFGFGRRACAGADLATNGLYIIIAKLLWTFDIKRVDGEVYDGDALTGGAILRPTPFKCEFVVRDECRRAVLEKEMEEAETFLELFPPFD